MLDTPPREPEWQSWTYVAIGALVIFFTIPVARAAREWIAQNLGLNFFLYLAAFVTVLIGLWAYTSLRSRNLSIDAYLCLFGIIAAFLLYIYHLREIPEEAIHVSEYGAIGILVFRALSHRTRDISIYLASTLVVGMIGILDEYIQWVAPSRYFDLRDIRTNLIAGGLGQLALALGLRPRIVAGWPTRSSLKRLSRVLALGLCLLVVGFMNTPQRIAWYASSIPALSFLLDSHSMMVEYGYRYHDPDIGIFRSRFSLDELQELDRRRGRELAGIFDSFINEEGYGLLLNRFTVPRDAYVHEAGVHMFRRDRYLDRAREEPDRQSEHYNVAYHENLILEKYFTTALNATRYRWDEATLERVRAQARATGVYESSVSAGVITRFRESQLVGATMLAIVVLLVLGYLPGASRGRIPAKSNRG